MCDKSLIFLENESFLSGSLLSIVADSSNISFALVNISYNEKNRNCDNREKIQQSSHFK